MDEGVGNGVPDARRKIVTADVDGEKVQRFPLSNKSWYRAKLNFLVLTCSQSSELLSEIQRLPRMLPVQKVVKIAEVALAFLARRRMKSLHCLWRGGPQ
jgi:hypothetical protein